MRANFREPLYENTYVITCPQRNVCNVCNNDVTRETMFRLARIGAR